MLKKALNFYSGKYNQDISLVCPCYKSSIVFKEGAAFSPPPSFSPILFSSLSSKQSWRRIRRTHKRTHVVLVGLKSPYWKNSRSLLSFLRGDSGCVKKRGPGDCFLVFRLHTKKYLLISHFYGDLRHNCLYHIGISS